MCGDNDISEKANGTILVATIFGILGGIVGVMIDAGNRDSEEKKAGKYFVGGIIGGLSITIVANTLYP